MRRSLDRAVRGSGRWGTFVLGGRQKIWQAESVQSDPGKQRANMPREIDIGMPAATFLVACMLALLFAQMAGAQDVTELQAQQASLDSKPAPAPTQLNGSVSKSGSLDAGTGSSVKPLDGSVQDTATQKGTGEKDRLGSLNGSAASNGKPRSFGLFHKWTSEDYRQLEFGITGLIEVKQIFGKYPTVIKLYPGCPVMVRHRGGR